MGLLHPMEPELWCARAKAPGSRGGRREAGKLGNYWGLHAGRPTVRPAADMGWVSLESDYKLSRL